MQKYNERLSLASLCSVAALLLFPLLLGLAFGCRLNGEWSIFVRDLHNFVLLSLMLNDPALTTNE